MQKKLLFIVNPRAGKTKSRTPLFEALAAYCAAGYLVNVQYTGAAGDAARIARELGAQYDMVVCHGGDGTLSETVNGVMMVDAAQRPCVGYLPGGSTNDFAASLRISSDLPEAARQALLHGTRMLDVGQFNDRRFVYVAAFGAFTRTSYRVHQDLKNMLGHTAYLLDGVKDLDTLRSYAVRITADGEVLDGEYLFGAVANTTSIAGLVKLDQTLTQPDDGAFELLLIRAPRTAAQLQSLVRAMLLQEYDSDAIIFRHISNVTVEPEGELPWALDGEYAPSAPRVEIFVEKQALCMMI
ncbi:MAG: diacylglycerol kinase family lipid kinase [Oscillospiraceae bacterium]|nr:diacylglycerol kinase family lipid kinase [Oscillospiraceae bacterium]